jgi:thiol:disulfide interchange protein
VKILIPVEAAGAVTLKAVSQGCWDGGICYPPINQEARSISPLPEAPYRQRRLLSRARLRETKHHASPACSKVTTWRWCWPASSASACCCR